MEELKPVADDQPFRITSVRARQAALTRQVAAMQDTIQFHARQSDMDMVKDLKAEIAKMKEQIALLARIHKQSDRQLYNEYVENYGTD